MSESLGKYLPILVLGIIVSTVAIGGTYYILSPSDVPDSEEFDPNKIAYYADELDRCGGEISYILDGQIYTHITSHFVKVSGVRLVEYEIKNPYGTPLEHELFSVEISQIQSIKIDH